ncbi:transcriptional regulator [Zhengella mangrovi]|uniref:Transcriptional regulator n=1 Tax=Zhengella mangrovi TaxID=1982044 RepID=A0A2G1QH89_9HYPH|nr:helix-turn-helix domain-containing protein [Zhengella mangrovi]PHP64820.1 transcriptional regulator [Zhengella mangrovi]
MTSETTTRNTLLLTETDVARQLGVSVRTLQSWRVKGGGPVFSKLGRSVRYRPSDVDAWVAGNLTTSTSQVTVGHDR